MSNVTELKKRPPVDAGGASVLIELRDGTIKFWHGSNHDLLLGEIKDARPGTWDELWASFRRLKGYVQLVEG